MRNQLILISIFFMATPVVSQAQQPSQTGRCMTTGIPSASAPLGEQAQFIPEIMFKAEFSGCNGAELERLRVVMLNDIDAVSKTYSDAGDSERTKILAIVADLKATLGLIETAQSRLPQFK